MEDKKVFLRQFLDFGSGVSREDAERKYREEDFNREMQKDLNMSDIAMNKRKKAVQLAGKYTANPHTTFIKDPTGSNKLIKFHYPLDLRSVEEKMKSYPFTQLS
tara:strand:- start:238 stop:549 length:312 start_codon:yes stop_codon:yes gene_type:complete